MMIDCNKATALISESRERPLTLRERFTLKIHLLLCHLCQRFKKTVDFLGLQATRYGSEESAAEDSVCLSDSAKQRIQQAIEDSQS